MKTRSMLAALGFLAMALTPAAAQEWPKDNVTIIVPFGPGSTPDTVARVLADRLQHRLGKTFVVENKSGASGNLGTGLVAKAEPDGHTLGVSIAGPLAVNSVLFPELPYDPFKDVTPLGVVASQPSVVVANSDLNVATFAELVELLKQKPREYNYGSIGVGSISHLAMELISTKSGARPVHVPFRGSPKAVLALIQGEVHLGCLPAASVAAQAKSGKLKMLAVTTAKRSSVLPDVPTLAESGLTDVESDAWVGLIAPAGLDPELARKINQEMVAAMSDPSVAEKLKAQYMEPVGSTSEDMAKLMRSELERWLPVIRAGNIRLD